MNNTFDEVELKLISSLDNFLIEAKQFSLLGDRVWTTRIKEILGDLGHQLENKVSIGGFSEKFNSEWLYDVVWYKENTEGNLISVPLVVESEWDKNYNGIKYDFEKLLLANTQNKLMICQSKNCDIENTFEKLNNAIITYNHNIGNRYLIAILDCNTDDKFYYKSFTKN